MGLEQILQPRCPGPFFPGHVQLTLHTMDKCRILLALVSTMDSTTNLPLPFRTAITSASLCTSKPIYLMSRLIQLPPWGKDHRVNAVIPLKVKCLSPAQLPIPSWSLSHSMHHRRSYFPERPGGAQPYTRSEAKAAPPVGF